MLSAVIDPVLLDCHPVKLCRLQYPNHPKGCPNVRRCAAIARPLPELARSPFRLFWTVFDLGAHVERMREKHPTWTKRQLRNVLYWQGKPRAELRREIGVFVQDLDPSTYFLTYCPEIHGVNVTATMAQTGVELEWPPVRWTRVVALMGMRR